MNRQHVEWAAKSPQATATEHAADEIRAVGRMRMQRRYRVALVGGALCVLIALGASAAAQSVSTRGRKSVPMPVPAPHSKARAAAAARTSPHPTPPLHTAAITTPAASAATSAPTTAPK